MNAIQLPALPRRTMRGGDLVTDLVPLLEQHRTQTMDLVLSRGQLAMHSGQLIIGGTEPQITEDGVYEVNGAYRLTDQAHRQLAGLFDIPWRYYARMLYGTDNDLHNLSLLDANVGSWANRSSKKVLLRCLWGTDPSHPEAMGIVRAVLSSRYGARDNLPTVMALLHGMRDGGIAADNIVGCDLSDDRLYVHVVAPEIAVAAPTLLASYTPEGRPELPQVWDHPGAGVVGEGPGEWQDLNPNHVIQAGLVVTNSETGKGKLKVIPRFRILRCMNGLQVTKDAMEKVHLGSDMPEGVVAWSAETEAKYDGLVRSQITDAVRTFLNRDYLAGVVARLEEEAGVELSNPQETIEQVSTKLGYTEAEKVDVLAHFIKGGQCSAGGLMNAVTRKAQDIEDVDRAHDFEATGIDAMRLAGKLEPAIAAKRN